MDPTVESLPWTSPLLIFTGGGGQIFSIYKYYTVCYLSRKDTCEYQKVVVVDRRDTSSPRIDEGLICIAHIRVERCGRGSNQGEDQR